MTGQEKGDILMQVTTQAGLTVYGKPCLETEMLIFLCTAMLQLTFWFVGFIKNKTKTFCNELKAIYFVHRIITEHYL